MNRSDQQKKKMGEKRRGIGFETVAGMGGAIIETLCCNSIGSDVVVSIVHLKLLLLLFSGYLFLTLP